MGATMTPSRVVAHRMPGFPVIRTALSGLLAMFVGIGVARFSFAPLVPALVKAQWYSASSAFWFATVNLAGYFIGVAAIRAWRGAYPAKPAMVLAMGLTAAATLCCALNWGTAWFGFWRLVSGLTGGVLMVLMASAVVGRAPPASRGRVSGFAFSGMGAGMTFSSLAIPHLLLYGLVFTWAALGALCAGATLIVALIMPPARIEPPQRHAAKGSPPLVVLLLISAYAFSALGFMPHMLFWSSFIAIGLGRGVAAGAVMAAWIGLAATLGPPLLGRAADRFGFLPTLAAGFVVMGGAVAIPLFTDAVPALVVSALCVGAVALGTVMLVAGAIAGMVPPARLSTDWGLAAMTYAITQISAAALLSHLFRLTGSYGILFRFGVGAQALGLLFISLAAWMARR
ncbi:YbfB/YjiJ family MFS transporter [Acidocella aminolytica]|jgi:MFS family permease|uniref:Major facilitator superfamily transporter n=1 Tax=Acidocella aminolytica 101 = DSM 11237 TaxID=1120923 RepID=A0A0D6PJ25_9PROT|nr:YbfB/YjiJ family MFS transporter [Acidocella aminolytica]GAN81667.1 major facilitator superfamily transporter [Acidocella aminolytica 101 = DSM 11237]GBQ40123.1 major facilitator superfamily transporter [Acidocella aminolytica 101 = DSM 11237]SHF19226.1 Predicted arabinose efflux permease, MFS family [Acidocella aminolytica 101 = DSM 11237]